MHKRARNQPFLKVASWAPVAEGASGEPVWDVVVNYLRDIPAHAGIQQDMVTK
jgi:hypothetical protein